MPTNDRRAIADELRRVASDSLNGESLWRALARIAGAEDSSWRCVMRRLADLIDQPTTSNLAGDGNYFICAKCGAEWPYDLGFTHCPECGAEVIND
mgnify:CR=1 FL=1|jgi:hypothetical protein